MLGENVLSDPKKAIEVTTVALRNAYPVPLRAWGMVITVTSDPTPANNRMWVLDYGYSDADKSNNSNWRSLTEKVSSSDYAGNSKLKFATGIEGYQSAVGTSFGAEIIASALIPNKTLLYVKVFVNGISSDGAEGYAGEVSAVFRKDNAGTLTRIGAVTTAINEDLAIGGVVADLTAVANGVTLSITIAGASGSWTQTAWLQKVQVTP